MSSNTKFNQSFEIIGRTILLIGAIAICFYIGFFGSGYYAGGLRGVIIFFTFFTVYVFVKIEYPKARQTMDRGSAFLQATKQLFYFWIQYKESRPKGQSKKRS